VWVGLLKIQLTVLILFALDRSHDYFCMTSTKMLPIKCCCSYGRLSTHYWCRVWNKVSCMLLIFCQAAFVASFCFFLMYCIKSLNSHWRLMVLFLYKILAYFMSIYVFSMQWWISFCLVLFLNFDFFLNSKVKWNLWYLHYLFVYFYSNL